MKKTAIKCTLLVLIFIVCAVFNLMCSVSSATRKVTDAADFAYSDVLADLNKDSSFNASQYPGIEDDYSLSVIQIAESINDELFVYVYQPSGKLQASSINIAREMDNSAGLGFRNYTLQYINSNGVFFKYKVQGFELRADAVRYYNISNILRPYHKSIDDPIGAGQTISEVPFAVGQFWTACTVNGDVSYTKLNTTVIEITKKYVGYVDIFDGADLNHIFIDGGSHTFKNFVAFTTDLPIDELIEAELQFSLSDYSFSQCSNPLCSKHELYSTFDKQKGTPVRQEPIIIKADQVTSNNQHGIGGHSYTWNKIQSTEDFIADNNNANYVLTTEGVNNLNGTQWVLNFFDTTIYGKVRELPLFDAHIDWSGELVSDVIILRLKFETLGEPYNLGVVDNRQTGSSKPINKPTTTTSTSSKLNTFLNNLVYVLIVIAAVVVVVLLIMLVVWVVKLFKPAQTVKIEMPTTKTSSAKRKSKFKKKGGKK